jgi:hypothetical protein
VEKETVVVTRYNNKSYKVTDIAFEMTPNDKFRKEDGM